MLFCIGIRKLSSGKIRIHFIENFSETNYPFERGKDEGETFSCCLSDVMGLISVVALLVL